IKKEKQITASALQDDMAARDNTSPAETPNPKVPADTNAAAATADTTSIKTSKKSTTTSNDADSNNGTRAPRSPRAASKSTAA
ncbi:hypothetical protein R0J93_26485, partial [Pseudoalteromonas sp. SIMBA_148]